MTFEVFDDLRLWGDTLQDNLVSPRSSRLHFNVSLPAAFSKALEASALNVRESTESGQVRSLASMSTTASSSYHNYISGLLSRVMHHNHHHGLKSNSFLHVTMDRLLFVTISQGRKPALIASWSFTKGEISVYGTGRVSVTSGDLGNKVFYLMETAGRYIFTCDKATELSAWIQRVTRPASYLYERRWLSSVASQLGENQALLLMPFDKALEQKVFDAHLRDTSKHTYWVEGVGGYVAAKPDWEIRSAGRPLCTTNTHVRPTARLRSMGDRATSRLLAKLRAPFLVYRLVPSCIQITRAGSRTRSIHLALYLLCDCVLTDSGRTRIRFLSHPIGRPVLSTGQPHRDQQQNSYVLRRSYSNVSTDQGNHNYHRRCLAESSIFRAYTNKSDGNDCQIPTMVALSPLPLDYLPKSTTDESGTRVDVEARVEEYSAAITTTTVSDNGGSATSASPAPLSSPSSNSTSAAPHRPTRSRLASSWTTSLSHPPCLLSAPFSSQGVRATASCVRAASECSGGGGGVGRGQQWQRELHHSLLVGVTCSVPWDAAATEKKPRTGRLYSSRDEIREAALKAGTTLPLSSLPSARTSCSGSFSERDDDDDIGNMAASGGHEQTSFTSADASSECLSHSSPPLASSPPAPPPSRYYANLGPISLPSVDDCSSVHRLMARGTTVASVIEDTSSATDSVIATSSAFQSVSRSANYLSYTPYVPLSCQGLSGYGRSGGRIRTLSSGQPSVRRNPMLPTRQPINGRTLRPSRLPAQTLGSLPQTPPGTRLTSHPTDVSDAAKLTSLRSQR
ncbi:unnamed protein product [Hydatigera taeniaeformis]|uniref:IRS-type PTB domain-containing protein n=1 Tax=Hydatigena taeniaeformis TaxID=6205 RepID=A0A0R3X1F1_HYDTA|nr:unnamed protein product [Hydatigera taeniaeformis]